jgi:hypothetical protein
VSAVESQASVGWIHPTQPSQYLVFDPTATFPRGTWQAAGPDSGLIMIEVFPIYAPEEAEASPWQVTGEQARAAVLGRVERCKRDHGTGATEVPKARTAGAGGRRRTCSAARSCPDRPGEGSC